MLHIIARIIETIATNRAARESKAHAQRKAQRMQRMQREAYAAEYTQAQRSMRDRNPYPFHQ